MANKYFQKNLQLMNRTLKKRFEERGRKAAELWKQFLIAMMEFTPKTGRWYTNKRQNGLVYTWQASAPGEYPAVVTGQLLDSVRTFVSVSDNHRLRVQLQITAPHAEALESDLADGVSGPHQKGKRPLLHASKEALRDIIMDALG